MNRRRSTREVVKDIILEHPDWNAAQIYEQYKVDAPGQERTLNAIQKHVQKLRPKLPTTVYWHLGRQGTSLSIPPEALPRIIAIQRELKALGNETTNMPQIVAYWIGQLYGVIDEPLVLLGVAYAYGLHQAIRIAAHPDQLVVDMTELDTFLVNKDYEALIGFGASLMKLLSKYNADEIDDNMPLLMARLQEVLKNNKKAGEK